MKSKLTPKRGTELKALKLMREHPALIKHYRIEDISQKHVGPDIIYVSKTNPKDKLFLEVKGMKNAKPQGFRLYKTYIDLVSTGKYKVALICNIHKRPTLFLLDGKDIKKWRSTKKSNQKNCYTINQVSKLVEEHAEGPIFL